MLHNSSQLVKIAVELADPVQDVEASFDAAISLSLCHTTYNMAIELTKQVARQATDAALGIRSVIGWDSHSYHAEPRNGLDTLLGLERALHQLAVDANSTKLCDGTQSAIVALIGQRIRAMALAAHQNTLYAVANAKAVEAVGALAIETIRALERGGRG
ncbi:hypothetical protein CR105_26770 [Massilia eurypsychrophila]|uniref:Uncharacterized protein n=1 Tax=Massilia eurypsychrophila TaxID=1485217 RepID=A0A2G8T7N0_9BURK|nr:hypothetical protein CR105_26770 [Massilia eurypsychrophila]